MYKNGSWFLVIFNAINTAKMLENDVEKNYTFF